ncbi:MAG: VWA domain-containing protein [Chitinophagaceae bacterium]|nr:VWA domain-containing protein [Chitinophagaceae bacterium]
MIRDQELAGLAMTLGRDAKIKITVGGDGSYCKPDGSQINIARMPSTPLGRMLMTGLVFHEIGHKNYTKGGRPDGLLGDMMNVIEDVRVDKETIKARPGTCFNLEAVTTHYVNKGSLEPANLAHALLGKVMAYGFGRVLKHKSILPLETLCNEMMDDAFGQEFIDDVDAIIKDIPKLRSTRDTTVMAQKLIDLLINPPSQQKQQQAGSQELQQQSQKGKGNGTGKKQATKPDDQKQEQDDTKVSGSGGNGAGKGGGKRPTPEEIAEMLKNKTGYGDLSALIRSELDDIAESTPSSKLAGIPMLPDIGRLKANYGKLDEVEAISAASRMRARMMGMLQSIKMQPKSFGLSGRKLANERLVRMATGDPRIFKKKTETKEVNTAIVVLLDLSGSMNGRYEVANAAAFALHTTLFGLKGVSICSMEFSGKDNEPEVNMLVDFGKKPKSENFNHHPFDGTPTDTAIWAGRATLLHRPEPRKIILILTDGCPDDSHETKAATKRTVQDGIEIAAIGIMANSVKHYWDNHKIIETIQELPSAMFGIMEGLLIKSNHPCQNSYLSGRSNP